MNKNIIITILAVIGISLASIGNIPSIVTMQFSEVYWILSDAYFIIVFGVVIYSSYLDKKK